jgi:branched-chain amino acid transport system substrate-binding protein
MKTRVLLAAAAIAACATSASAEEILIGVPVSLTGVYAFVGTAAVKGMQMAVDEINAGSELGAGRSIKLVIADDGSNTNQAITLVNRMANVDKVMAIAGPSASPTVLAVSPVVNQLQIPMVGIAVTPAVNKAGPWSNRVLNSPAALMTVLSNYTLANIKPKTVMTVASRDNDGAAAQTKVVRSVMEGKVTLMPEESAMMAETDFSALATKIASLKPDVVMITMNDSAAANIILQAKQAGADSKLRFVANNAAASASFLRIGGKAVEGVLVGTDALPEIRSDALAKTFVANFQKKYNATPDQWNAVGYTIGRLYGNAIAKAKSPLSKQSILDAMIATRDFPVVLGSGKGNFSFTPGDREPSYEPILIVVKDGKFAPAP